MKITCVADLHGFYPKLSGGDLLIIAGDLTGRHTTEEALDFIYWLSEQDYKEKIVIAGNHDTFLIPDKTWFVDELERISKSIYLCDSGTEFEGLKIWGSPYSLWFYGINPKCKAFTGSENYLSKKFSRMPDDIDILITHSPPYGIFDKTYKGEHVGSKSLGEYVSNKVAPKLWVFGHIHECGGQQCEIMANNTDIMKLVNCSHVNERYEPVNAPIEIEL